MGEKRVLVITYWAFQDALVQTYTLPYLRIMTENATLSIWLICLQPVGRAISKKELASINEKLNASRIHLLLFDYKPLNLIGYLNTAAILFKLIYLIIKLRISVIHAWATPAGALGYMVAKLLGKKLVIDSYEPHAEASVENGTWKRRGLPFRFLFWMEKLQSHQAESVIAVTEGMRDYARIKYNISFGSNFFVKPACVDFELFDYRNLNSDLKNSLGLKDKIVALYAGKFGGIYLDIEFFRWLKVAEQHWKGKFRLVLLTSHSEKEILEFCKKAGVSREIILRKFVPHHEVPTYMAMADFALSIVKPVASKRYCSPIKDGEYWAMGLPVIITKGISDDSDIIKAEKIGYVLEKLNDEEYLNSMKEIEPIFSDPSNRLKIIKVAEKYRSVEIARKVYRHVYPN